LFFVQEEGVQMTQRDIEKAKKLINKERNPLGDVQYAQFLINHIAHALHQARIEVVKELEESVQKRVAQINTKESGYNDGYVDGLYHALTLAEAIRSL
jgi:DNA repair exonuclease SbcCD ATPase subunit